MLRENRSSDDFKDYITINFTMINILLKLYILHSTILSNCPSFFFSNYYQVPCNDLNSALNLSMEKFVVKVASHGDFLAREPDLRLLE